MLEPDERDVLRLLLEQSQVTGDQVAVMAAALDAIDGHIEAHDIARDAVEAVFAGRVRVHGALAPALVRLRSKLKGGPDADSTGR